MNQDTTPTSGAADLPEALRSIQRFEVVDCIDDNHVPAVIPKPHGPWVRYEDHIAALAAGQATAAQQGAYAALSESFLEIPDVQDESGINAYYSREVVLECIDAALASHGQAPATQQAGIPGNFITHRAAWREALETAKFVSTGVDRSYWDHELAAFDRSFDRLWTLMQDAPRKQGASHDR